MIEKPMKPFDLEAALEGAPVIATGGPKPLLVTDLKLFEGLALTPGSYCLAGVLHLFGDKPVAHFWTKDGTQSPHGYTLHMAPTPKSAWLVVHESDGSIAFKDAFHSRADADAAIRRSHFGGIKVVCVEWEV